jgi:DeoR/GlpR family transcriptional regulator of sugar metabolism
VADHRAKRVETLPAQRRAQVLDFVRERGAATMRELADGLHASLSTIRRDLEQLVDDGYLEKTHGGVLLRRSEPTTFDTESSLNAHLSWRQKRAIGATAALRVSPGDSILCDSSTTVLEVMRRVVARPINVTVVTNSLEIASICAPCPSIRLVVPGGTLRPGTMSLFGPPGSEFFSTLHVDLCFLGIHSITGDLMTETSVEGAEMKRLMLKSSRRTILVADSTKFRLPSFCTVGNISELEELITDDAISADCRHTCQQADLALTVVWSTKQNEAGS